MAVITEATALIVLPLSKLKDELRIEQTETSHDALLTGQIVSAVSYVSRTTGATGDDLLPLRMAAVSVARDLYDGFREVKENAASNAWMDPYKSYGAG